MKRLITLAAVMMLAPTAAFAVTAGWLGELGPGSGADFVYNCSETYPATAMDDAMDLNDGTFTPVTAASGFTNGRTGYGSGYFDGGLFFNSDGSTVAPNTPLTTGVSGYVMQAWVKFNGSQWNQRLFSDGGHLAMTTAGYLEVLQFSAGNHYARTVASIPIGVWTHIAVVYDGSGPTSKIDIYWNGVLQALQAGFDGTWAGSSTYNGSGAITFGGPDLYSRKLHGWADDISISMGDSILIPEPGMMLAVLALLLVRRKK